MRLRELSDENKNKSHGNVTRSTSAYGDTKYVQLSYDIPDVVVSLIIPNRTFLTPFGSISGEFG